MTYGDNRVGQGRWCVIMTPSEGVLWTDDADSLGFQPIPPVGGREVDTAPIDIQIAMAHDAGRSATEAFDAIAAVCGKQIESGDLRNWRKNRQRARPDLGAMPMVTSPTEIKQMTVAGDGDATAQ